MLLTKYNAAHFAYGTSGRLVVDLPHAKAGVAAGIDDLDRVIAHETCHLFEAPDEYGNCVALAAYGPFGAPNGNCPNPVIAAVPCLMNGLSDTMCAWTKAHVGWNPLPFPIPPGL